MKKFFVLFGVAMSLSQLAPSKKFLSQTDWSSAWSSPKPASIIDGPVATDGDLSNWANHLEWVSFKLGFDPDLLLAVADAESGQNARAVSNRGAIGLLQLQEATAAQAYSYLSSELQDWVKARARTLGFAFVAPTLEWNGLLKDRFINLLLGAAYLSYLRESFLGQGANFWLAAYNLGPEKARELRQRGHRSSQVAQFVHQVRSQYFRRKDDSVAL